MNIPRRLRLFSLICFDVLQHAERPPDKIASFSLAILTNDSRGIIFIIGLGAAVVCGHFCEPKTMIIMTFL